eukprot:3325846-Prorocentrum_lima.AAC.1
MAPRACCCPTGARDMNCSTKLPKDSTSPPLLHARRRPRRCIRTMADHVGYRGAPGRQKLGPVEHSSPA